MKINAFKLQNVIEPMSSQGSELATNPRMGELEIISSASRFMGALSATIATMSGVMFAVVTVVSRLGEGIGARLSGTLLSEPIVLAVFSTAVALTAAMMVLILFRRAELAKREEFHRSAYLTTEDSKSGERTAFSGYLSKYGKNSTPLPS